MIWLYLQRETNLFTAPHTILDVAPEPFLSTRLQKIQGSSYLSIDLESPLAMRHMDLRHLDLTDHSFDVIFCNHVFEHIPEDQQAMREVRRVLKPQGWAILQTPFDRTREVTEEDFSVTDPKERLRRFGQDDHVRIYGLDLFDRLKASGWQIERVPYVQNFSPEDVRRFGLLAHDEIILGRVA